MTQQLLIFWVLPALIVLLAWMIIVRIYDEKVPQNYSEHQWNLLITLTVLWPLGFALLLAVLVVSVLEEIQTLYKS